jgi:hypothetical protein
METGALLHLPRTLKLGIALSLGLALAGSAGFLLFALIHEPSDSPLLPNVISLFQFTATGSALAIIAFFSTKNIGTSELLAQTSRFLVDEMPLAFRSSLIVRSLKEENWSVTSVVDEVSEAVVFADHVRGTASATYLVKALGSTIKLRVTLNAFRFVVLYYIPNRNHSIADVAKKIDLVTGGAKTVGYSYRVATNTDLDDRSWIEVYFYKMTDKDLLLDSSSRLFWSQDIAVMTKSMLLQLQRGGISLEDDPDATLRK